MTDHDMTPPDHRADSTELPRIKLTDTSDVLAIVPYLLGFHPADSLVVMIFCGGQLKIGARVDLDVAERSCELEERMRVIEARFPGFDCFVAVYTSDAGLFRQLLGRLDDVVPGGGWIDVVRVVGERYWSPWCGCGGWQCDGHSFDSTISTAAASAVAAGLQALDSRADAVAAAYGPIPEQLAEVIRLHQAVAEQWAGKSLSERKRRVRELALGVPSVLAASELAELAVLIQQVRVRDEALGIAMAENPDQQYELWCRVTAQCPDRWAVAPLCLLGMVAWRLGNGSMLSECLVRASRLAPNDVLVKLLGRVIDEAIPPDAVGVA